MAALATGVRGTAREALLASLDALTEADDRGGEFTDLHVRRLKPRTRLFDPRRPGFIARMGARLDVSLSGAGRISQADRVALWADAGDVAG